MTSLERASHRFIFADSHRRGAAAQHPACEAKRLRWLAGMVRAAHTRQLAAVARLVGLSAVAPPEIVADRIEEEAFDPRKL